VAAVVDVVKAERSIDSMVDMRTGLMVDWSAVSQTIVIDY